MARLTPSVQKTENIAVKVEIPREIYKDMFLVAIDSDENLKDMFIEAFNKFYLKSKWKSYKTTHKRKRWELREKN